jgi:CHAT domain-containing protein
MKNKYLPFFIVALLAITPLNLKAQKVASKEQFQIEANYRNGDYTRSRHLCDKIIRLANHNSKIDKGLLAYAQLYKIKNEFVFDGRIENVKKLENSYLATLNQLDQGNSKLEIEGMGELAKEYALNGYQKQANEMLSQAFDRLSSLNLKPSTALLKSKVVVLNTLGNSLEAFQLGLTLKADLLSLALKEEYTVQSKDGTKIRKYTSKQLASNKRAFADFTQLLAQCLFNFGAYHQVDSMLAENYKWIGNHLSNKDVSAFDNRLLLVKNYEKLEHEEIAYALCFNKQVLKKDGLKVAIDAKYKGYSYYQESMAYLDYEDFLARHYWIYGNLVTNIKGDDLHAKHYSTYMRRGQHGANVNLTQANIMLIDKALFQNDFKLANRLIDSLLVKKQVNGSLFIPANHPYRHLLLIKSIQTSVELKNLEKLEIAQEALAQVNDALLVPGSPTFLADKTYGQLSKFEITQNYQQVATPFAADSKILLQKDLYPLHPYYHQLLFGEIDLLLNAGEFKKAEEQIERYLTKLTLHKDDNQNRYAIALIKKAETQLYNGHYKEATTLLDNENQGPIFTLIKQKDFKFDDTKDQYYRKLTFKHLVYGDMIKAKQSFKEIQNLTIRDYIDFTPIYISKGKENYIKDKLLTIEKEFEAKNLAETEENLFLLEANALLDALNGDFGQATKHIDLAVNLSQKIFGSKSHQYADANFHQAMVSANLGDYQNAVKSYQLATNLYKAKYGERSLYYAKGLSETNLAKLYAQGHDSPQIETELLLASNIVKNTMGYTTIENANILKNLSFFYLEHNKVGLAERDIIQSIQILKDLGESTYKEQLADNYIVSAKIQQHNKEFKESENSFKKALSYYQDLYSDKNHLDITLAKSSLAQLYYLQGEHKDSRKTLNATTENYLSYIDKYFAFLTERQKKEFWKKINPDFEFYKTLAFEENNPKEVEAVYNNALMTKGILLNSVRRLRQTILESQDQQVIAQFERYTQKSEELSYAISLSQEQLVTEGLSVELLQREVDKLEKSLSEKSTDFAQLSKDKVTWEDVKNALATNEYAIEIVRYKLFTDHFTDTVLYKALIIGKDYPSIKVVNLTNGNDLEEKYVHYYRNTTRFRKDDYVSYEAFYKPIYDIVGKGAKVYLSNDGIYNLVNLEALRVDDSTFVIDYNNILIVGSTKDLLNKPIAKATKTNSQQAYLVANPMYYQENISSEKHANIGNNQTISQLKGAEEEGTQLNQIFSDNYWKPTLITWDQAEEQSFKNISAKDHYQYLHIATHGFFENAEESTLASTIDNRRTLSDPYLRAGLLFKNAGDIMDKSTLLQYNQRDGVLTAKEVSNANLSGVSLCVLSACETGLGDVAAGEGVYGLQRAFLTAGAKQVVISLFKVDDQVTKLFMVKLAERYVKTNNAKEAMQFAKTEVRKVYPQPLYWGSFILVE